MNEEEKQVWKNAVEGPFRKPKYRYMKDYVIIACIVAFTAAVFIALSWVVFDIAR